MDIDTIVEEKISADADFQAELELLSDDERNQALADKKAELTRQEFAILDEKAKKAEQIAEDRKIRAEKAEREAKAATKSAGDVTPKNTENLSLKDIRALQDIADEDVDEVMDFAKFKNIPIAEAKKHPAVQALIKTREEERKTAEAASSGTGRRAVSRNTGEAILERVSRGELPESDDDIKKLAEARLQAKIAQHSK